MLRLPEHIELKFFEVLSNQTSLKEFESWIYANTELEALLPKSAFLKLISVDFEKNGAKYEVENLLYSDLVERGKLEKWRILNSLKKLLSRDKKSPQILAEFYDFYSHGYEFLKDLGLGYGLQIAAPRPYFTRAGWEKLPENRKKRVLDSFYPQLDADIQRAISWIEKDLIVFSSITNIYDLCEYDDVRDAKEKESTVFFEVRPTFKQRHRHNIKNLFLPKHAKIDLGRTFKTIINGKEFRK